jgi:hypothetical protein
MTDEKMNGSSANGACNEATEEISEEYYTRENPPQSEREEIDPSEYRSGKPMQLTNITAAPSRQRILVRKPGAKEWFRTRSAEEIERAYLFENDDGEFYLVHPRVVEELPDEFAEHYLIPCINTASRLSLWPIKIGSEYTEKAIAHAVQARAQWIRRKWVKRIKGS